MSSALVDWALEATANSTYKLVRYSGIRWLAQKVRRQMALHMKGFGATLYPSRDSLQQARDFEEFLGTAEIIDAIYLVGRSFVRDHSSRYRRFRRVILPDPSSASFRFYETASGEPNLGEAVRRSTSALRENGIKVRWCPELIQQSLLIGDADRKTGWVHVEFVLPCSKANKRPSITVYKSRFEGLVESYKDSFNLLWDLSKEPTDEVKLLPGPNNAIQAPPITSGLSARDATASIVRSRLLTPGWVLNFNPSHPRGWKHISFIANGNIGEGKNPNEFVGG